MLLNISNQTTKGPSFSYCWSQYSFIVAELVCQFHFAANLFIQAAAATFKDNGTPAPS